MTEPDAIDEAARRKFERDRRSGGTTPIESFLPPPGSPSRRATLEELVYIELEFSTKRDPSSLPSIAELLQRFPELRDPEIEARLVAEVETIHESVQGTATAQAPAMPQAGDRIGRYELHHEVGRGAFAQVWRATDTQLHRPVAIKITRPDLATDPEARARVQREARSAAQLRHPGVVPVYDVVTWHDCPCIVSEFLSGDTMAVRLARARPDADTAARWIADLAESLDYAHQCGVIHRDVKPGNVMMADDGRPKLTDFGLAQLQGADLTLTQQGDVLGTPAYLSPEQARGHHAAIDARSDVYSLGVMLYEALTGSRPHESTSTASLLYKVIHDEPEPPRTVAADVPLDLETICLVAMAKESDRRFASAAALAADLRRYLAREPIQARRLSFFGRSALWIRRNRVLSATIATSLAVVAIVAFVGYYQVLNELYRSRVAQVRALLVARDSDWHGKAKAVLESAAAMAHRDPRELRDLALSLHGSSHRWFELLSTRSIPNLRRVAASTKHLAILDGDGAVQIQAHAGGEIGKRTFSPRASLTFVPGHALLVIAADSKLSFWHYLEDRVETVDIRSGRVLAVRASHEHVLIACSDGTVRRLDPTANAAAAPQLLTTHEGGAFALAISHDGKLVASGGDDKIIRIHDLGSHQLLGEGPAPNPIRSLAFTTNDRAVLWSAWETYGFGTFDWRVPLEGQFLDYGGNLHDDAVRAVVALPRGDQVTASADGTVRAWDHLRQPLAIARSESGAAFFAIRIPGTSRIATCYSDDTMRIWELRESPYRDIVKPTNCIGFRPDSDRFYVDTGEYHLTERAPARVEYRGYPRANRAGPTWGLDVSPDGAWLVTTSHNGFVEIWKTDPMEFVHGIDPGVDPGWSVAFDARSERCSIGFDKTIITYEVATGRELQRLTPHDRLVVALAYHPTAPVLASASYDSTVKLFDTGTGQELGTLTSSATAWRAMHITADGRYLMLANSDTTVRVWDLTVGPLARTFRNESPEALQRTVPESFVLRDQKSATWSLATSPDGRILFVGTQNGQITVYRVGDFRCVARFSTDIRMIRGLSFSSDGHYLAAGCYGHRSFLLDLDGLRRELRALGLDW